MLKRLVPGAIVSFSLLVSGSPARAQQEQAAASSTQMSPNYNGGDRNERICEKITPVGSRLTTKRFCGTRAEWEEKRRLDREEVEKAQRGPCVRQAGC